MADLDRILKDLRVSSQRSWHCLRLDGNHFLVDAGVQWYVCDRKTIIEMMKAGRGSWKMT